MTTIDRMLQNWRIRVASKHLKKDDLVLDVGCANGAMFSLCGPFGEGSLGVDPDLDAPLTVKGHSCVPGRFPAAVPFGAMFDAVSLLAVAEHIPYSEYTTFQEGLSRCLRPGGRVVVTVPSPFVDCILWVLMKLKLIHGMALEEHHGFKVRDVYRLFPSPHFSLVVHRKFMLGLNNLFVFSYRS
ncbi:MAG: methyltransferase domain-containing protein [Kiritimatiellia bacterium]|nr:methyltransferase domain-containing protein [Kiritimatiellia bacterium]